MKQQFENFIRSTINNPIDAEINAILEIFHLKHFAKGEHFKYCYNISKQVGFILEGSVRVYAIKKNGDELTGRIMNKNHFATDFVSLRTGEKTPISIEAIEPTSMLVASYENIRSLLEVNLTFNKLIREYLAESTIKLGKLHYLFLAGTATERYRFILESNPHLLKNIPLRFIASMIGVTPTQLSRIRNKKRS